jgi:two-component system, LytTR family, response regulator
MKLRIVILEDEKLGQQVLENVLKTFCDEIADITGFTAEVEEAVQLIKNTDPHLVFFDIKLGANENGAFDILSRLNDIRFKMIFTTSAEAPEFILRALNKYNVKKYLLKPLDIDEILNSIKEIHQEFNFLKNTSPENELPLINRCSTVKVPQKNGFKVVKCDDLIMLRSNANSTVLFLTNGENLNSSKNLAHYETILPKEKFLRGSRSFIVNVDHVLSYSNEDGGTINLTNNCTAALSGKTEDNFVSLWGE